MILCPFCGHRNIDGADVCDDCQEPLSFLSKPTPHNELERSVLNARVFMLAPRRPIVVSPETTVCEVLDLLVTHSIGCVVIVEQDQIVGIFSERDALNRLGTDISQHEDRPIREYMTSEVETIDRETKLAFALQKMDTGGYRHLPVTEDGRICGVISIRDVLDYVTANLLATAD